MQASLSQNSSRRGRRCPPCFFPPHPQLCLGRTPRTRKANPTPNQHKILQLSLILGGSNEGMAQPGIVSVQRDPQPLEWAGTWLAALALLFALLSLPEVPFPALPPSHSSMGCLYRVLPSFQPRAERPSAPLQTHLHGAPRSCREEG